jgi:hypothetical protein
MTSATQKDKKFVWTPKCQKAFKQIKDAITKEPVLVIFDPNKPVELETNTFNFAIASVVGQRDN